jgi:hypothetical protein
MELVFQKLQKHINLNKIGVLELIWAGLSTKKISYQQKEWKFNKTLVWYVNPTKFVESTMIF